MLPRFTLLLGACAAFCLTAGTLSASATRLAGPSTQTTDQTGQPDRIDAAVNTTVSHSGKVEDASAGRPLELNDIVRTSSKGAARIVLSDGSSIRALENSELRLVRHDLDTQQTLIELLHGHLQIAAATVTKTGGFFRIHTPTAVIFALGTDLEVKTESPTPVISGLVQAVSNGTPIANADVVLMLANAGKIGVGKTDNQGRKNVAVDALAIANLGKVPFHAEVDECDNKTSQLYVVAEGAQLTQPAKGCKRRRFAGVFFWDSNTPTRLTVDVARGTVAAEVITDATASTNTPPKTLEDIGPNIRPGVAGSISLSDYRDVGSTVVTCLSHFVAVTNVDPTQSGATYLLPGQSSTVNRGTPPKPAVQPTAHTTVPGPEFDLAGRPCQPAWVVNGELVPDPDNKAEIKYEYKMTGLGTSTGDALNLRLTNESRCALYFLITDGTILHPKGYTERVVVSLLVGGVPPLKDFQKMITVGGFLRVPPAETKAGTLVPGEASMHLRSYCVELHKLAPHPKTEYKFGDEDDQKNLGPNRAVIDRMFLLAQTRQLTLGQAYSLDSVLQWSLWSKIERLDNKKFAEEFEKLVHKNYDAQKKKWNKDAEHVTATNSAELWKLVEAVLKPAA